MRKFTLLLICVVILYLLLSPAVAAGSATTLYFHWTGGLSPYRQVTVEIESAGLIKCRIDGYSGKHESIINITSQEFTYFKRQFEHVLGLPPAAVQKMATDSGMTTLRITENNQSRELKYIFTDNPWALGLQQAIWRIVHRESALLELEQADPEKRYHAAYDILSDLRLDEIFHPEELRAPLLKLAGEWPLPGLSFDHSRATITNLLQSLAYCESKEQWAEDAMKLYVSKSPEAKIVLLRAIALDNFLSDVKDRQGKLLVPVMLQGLEEILDDALFGKRDGAAQACRELVTAIGWLRDARGLELLTSDKLWGPKPTIIQYPAGALARFGMAGVQELLKKVQSTNPQIRKAAESALYYAAEFYAFPYFNERPDLGKTAEMRKFLAARGYGATGVDGFNLPREAAPALKAALPDWQIMETADFDPLAVSRVRTDIDDRAGPQRCRGDFDGDGKRDIALLLKKEGTAKLAALRQTAAGWVVEEIAEFPFAGKQHNGLGSFPKYVVTQPATTTEFWAANGTAKSGGLEPKYDGIALHHEGGTSVIYFWNGQDFKSER